MTMFDYLNEADLPDADGIGAVSLRAQMVRRQTAIDWPRVAQLMAARPLRTPVKRVPREAAQSAGPCRRCGVPGRRGCEHQLPFGTDQ